VRRLGVELGGRVGRGARLRGDGRGRGRRARSGVGCGTHWEWRCSYPAKMKVAVISDIHANRHAFEATLDAVAASDAAELWCLGDLVGYGAEPDACVQL